MHSSTEMGRAVPLERISATPAGKAALDRLAASA
jgi:hypothetical protein